MQAIILAAGMGKRLKKLTRSNTKCMVEVNGVTLIERLLRQLDEKKLKRVVIVTGYEREKLKDYIAGLDGINVPVQYIDNPDFAVTNNIYSLYLARTALAEDDTLLFESDIIFERAVLDCLIEDERPTLALVAKYQSWMDGTCLKIGPGDIIEEFVPKSRFRYDETGEYFKTVNIYKFSRHFSVTHYLPFLEAYIKALGNNEYYEQVLSVITMLDDPEISAKVLPDDLRWYEIDDLQDLDIAGSMFARDSAEEVQLLESRYGGFWRYPGMLDFCYLVNPYFPPAKMLDEMKASYDTLLMQYPSGSRVISLLAGKNFGVESDHIVVGNGAAELIKAYFESISGTAGFIRPTFEEYVNRYDPADSVCFEVPGPDFSYTARDVIDYFDNKNLEHLVVINPDNPSGNYIPHDEMKTLIDWTKKKNIRLVIDESFADFADEADNSFIRDDLLEANPHVAVVKSISKSYGVPGLRLGVLASADTKLVGGLKKQIPIWNINSFAEFYLQIAEKYGREYTRALETFRAERRRFFELLEAIPGIRVIPSGANYFMAELTGTVTAKECTERLLSDFGILIKDLSKKTGNGRYIRIAVRNSRDNDALAKALAQILSSSEEKD